MRVVLDLLISTLSVDERPRLPLDSDDFPVGRAHVRFLGREGGEVEKIKQYAGSGAG